MKWRDALAGLGKLEPVAAVLVDLPAGAKADHRPTIADLVGGDDSFGEHHGMVDGDWRDHRGQAQAGHGDGDGGENRPTVERRLVAG